MTSSQPPSDKRTRAIPALILGAFCATLAVGCASPGPPRAPSLNLPQPVSDLTAVRVDDQVLLRWTTPSRTTDGLALKHDLSARICRTAVPPSPITASAPKPGTQFAPLLAQPFSNGTPGPDCKAVMSISVKPGVTTASDPLPSALTSDPAALLDYRVELINSSGHSAGLSHPAYAAAGTAPAGVEFLHASALPSGALLEWAPSTSIAFAGLPSSGVARPVSFLDLDRVNPALATPKAAPNAAKPKAPQSLKLAGQETAEVHLRAAGPATGTIDPTARFGQTYVYTAQRVRPVTLNGHALELRSAISPPITLTLTDTFPPAVPTGLSTIPTVSPERGIDLSWQPNTEPDLAGYLVYRRTVSSASDSSANAPSPPATPTRLTPVPIPGSAFRDSTVTAGQRYAYTVTAIDSSNNESKPSAEAEDELPKP